MSDNTAIRLQDVHAGYGKMEVLFGITLHVANGEIVALVGPNGTGKTTTLRTIVGQVRARSGSLEYMGEDISHKPPYALTRKGIATSPEGRAILGNLTVLENLRLGAYTIRDPAQFRRGLERVYALFPILKERDRQQGGTLSGGEQQMLAIGRALMSEPRMLMMDEPSMGIAPILVMRIFQAIKQLRDEGMTILLVEQNARAALRLADRGYVMETGSITLSGLGRELLDDRRVQEAYLGE